MNNKQNNFDQKNLPISNQAVISLKDVHKSYPLPDGKRLQILKGVDLEVEAGQMVIIHGKSGAGKSTLLHLLGLLDDFDAGHIEVLGQNIDNLVGEERTAFRNEKIGFVFQFHHLLPDFTALENIMLPTLVSNYNKKKAKAAAQELLEIIGLTDRQEHYPNQLSGGECQRIAIARAFINSPAVILADEPLGSLDLANSQHLRDLIVKMCALKRQTFMIVTHDTQSFSDVEQKFNLHDGQMVKI